MAAIGFPFTIDSTGSVSFVRDPAKEAVNQVVNALTTNTGERVLRYSYGAGVREYLFEALDEIGLAEVRQRVTEALRVDVPEVRVAKVEVDQTENVLNLRVFFTLTSEIDGNIYVATVTEGQTNEEVI